MDGHLFILLVRKISGFSPSFEYPSCILKSQPLSAQEERKVERTRKIELSGDFFL